MPIYEYSCSDCANKFEELVLSSRQYSIRCPSCGSEDTEKLISIFGFVSKSGGVTTSSSFSSECGSCSSHNCNSCSCGH